MKCKSLFYSDEYLNATLPNGSWGVEKVVENGQVIGEVYYRIVKKYGFTRIESLPLSPAINFPMASLKGVKNVRKSKRERRILLDLFDALPEYDELIIKLGTHIKDWRPLFWKGKYSSITRYTSTFEVQDLESLESNYEKSLRIRIKKASQNLRVVTSNEYDDCYSLMLDTYGRKNDKISFTEEVFNGACEVFKSNNSLNVWKAYKQNILIGFVVVFEDQGTAYSLFSGLKKEHKGEASQALLRHLWVKDALQRGFRVDLNGSMMKSIDAFNISFNPRTIPYYEIKYTKNIILKIRNRIKSWTTKSEY